MRLSPFIHVPVLALVLCLLAPAGSQAAQASSAQASSAQPSSAKAQYQDLMRQYLARPVEPLTAHIQPTEQKAAKQPKIRLTGLFVAVASGDLNKVKGLTPGRSGINGIDISSGGTPLTWAAQYGDPRMVAWFISKGARVDLADGLKYTPLITAARYGNTSAVRVLLDYGADPNQENALFQLPLQVACGPDGNLETVRLLIARGAQPDRPNSRGWTALGYAAKNGRMDIAEYLLALGADANGCPEAAFSPLHWAVNEGHEDMARLLLAHGANVNAKGDQGITPLAWCKTDGLRQMLLKQGAR